ncbi:hypothetical protein PIQ37_19560, partial [Xanthomonas sontii]
RRAFFDGTSMCRRKTTRILRVALRVLARRGCRAEGTPVNQQPKQQPKPKPKPKQEQEQSEGTSATDTASPAAIQQPFHSALLLCAVAKKFRHKKPGRSRGFCAA